jgi:hypothetical protein
MRTLLLPALVLLSAVALPAQREARPAKASQGSAKETNAAKEQYDKLVAEYKAAQEKNAAAARELMKTDEYKAAAKAKDGQALTALRQKLPPFDAAPFVARFREGAEKHKGTDDAIDFLAWIATNAGRDRESATTAVDALLEQHIKSRKLETFAENLGFARRSLDAERWNELCARLAEDSPHNVVRAWAMYWPAMMVQRDRGASAEQKEKAQQDLAAAEALVPGTELADMIAAPRFEQERLQIGMVAPDIAGEDTAGVKFKLSDYRGKVVVIDFWGDW